MSVKRVLLLVGGIAVVLLGLLVGVWEFLTPADHKEAVPFSRLQSDVAAGQVEQIRIDEKTYDYRLRAKDGPSKLLRAEGPVPTLAIVTALRPATNDVMPPKMYFGDGGSSHVPFSDFVAELDSGRVAAVHLDGPLWRYELKSSDGKAVKRETRGPKASSDEGAAFVKAHAPATTFDVD